MIAALLVLVPVVVAAVWAFLRFSPPRANPAALRRFNALAVGAALLLAAAWTARTWRVMTPTVDRAWWPVVSALGALAVIPSVLGLAALARGLLLRRRR